MAKADEYTRTGAIIASIGVVLTVIAIPAGPFFGVVGSLGTAAGAIVLLAGLIGQCVEDTAARWAGQLRQGPPPPPPPPGTRA